MVMLELFFFQNGTSSYKIIWANVFRVGKWVHAMSVTTKNFIFICTIFNQKSSQTVHTNKSLKFYRSWMNSLVTKTRTNKDANKFSLMFFESVNNCYLCLTTLFAWVVRETFPAINSSSLYLIFLAIGNICMCGWLDCHIATRLQTHKLSKKIRRNCK